jgi:hypothetical protein
VSWLLRARVKCDICQIEPGSHAWAGRRGQGRAEGKIPAQIASRRRWSAHRALRGAPFVAVMETADLGELDDRPVVDRLRLPSVRCILAEAEMCSGAVIVVEVAPKEPLEVRFIPGDDMIETFAPNRADETLDVRVLPRGVGCGAHVRDGESRHPPAERGAIDAVPIPEEIAWRRIPGKRLDDLLRRPFRSRMLGDVDMQHAVAGRTRTRAFAQSAHSCRRRRSPAPVRTMT